MPGDGFCLSAKITGTDNDDGNGWQIMNSSLKGAVQKEYQYPCTVIHYTSDPP
jgi:hypothetical protein